MGHPKMLLSWGGESIISHLVRLWERLGAVQTVVVINDSDRDIRGEFGRRQLTEVQCIVNPDAHGGMLTSIQAAVRWNGWSKTLSHWTVILGDQPHLSESTLQQLITTVALHPEHVCQPYFSGHGRHPVVIPAAAFHALGNTLHPTLKHFLQAEERSVHRVRLDDEALAHDIDTMEDYQRVLSRFPPAASGQGCVNSSQP